MTKNDRLTIRKSQDGAYNFDPMKFNIDSVTVAINNFLKQNPLFIFDECFMSLTAVHSYYDSIETEVKIIGERLETDYEYSFRLEKERLDKIRDAENYNKNKELAKQVAAQKDKKEFIRLSKKFKGEEIDPNSL